MKIPVIDKEQSMFAVISDDGYEGVFSDEKRAEEFATELAQIGCQAYVICLDEEN